MELSGIKSANKMMPLLKSITKNIIKLWHVIIEQRNKLDKAKKNNVNIEDVKTILNKSIDEVNEYIKEIEKLGCFVEEFKRGIVNIPSLYCGRKIFLAVIPTQEEKIKFWHELDETYSDKQTIDGFSILE